METHHGIINHTEHYSLEINRFMNALDAVIESAIDYGQAEETDEERLTLKTLDDNINLLFRKLGISADWYARNGHLINRVK
jgi:hypothetical protein